MRVHDIPCGYAAVCTTLHAPALLLLCLPSAAAPGLACLLPTLRLLTLQPRYPYRLLPRSTLRCSATPQTSLPKRVLR